jgi:hypothetical protein
VLVMALIKAAASIQVILYQAHKHQTTTLYHPILHICKQEWS